MILCHINLNLEYAQLHNKTAGNNQVLLIVEFCVHVKVMYIKYFANYLLMYVINTLSAPYLVTTQTYLTLLTFCI